MAKLVDLKMTREERDRMYEPVKAAEEGPIYPWGLSLNFDDATIQKLGTGNVPTNVGEEVTFTVRAKVTRAEISQHEGGKEQRSVSMQITAIALEGGSSDEATAEKLYDGAKAGA